MSEGGSAAEGDGVVFESGGSARVAVLCPMAVEWAAVKREVERAGLSGELGVDVFQCGVGWSNAHRAAWRVCERPRFPPDLVIVAGVCGVLGECAAVPEIGKVVDECGGEWRPRGRREGAEGAGAVTLVGVDRIVSTPAEKRALGEATGAAVVDMESHAVAAVCESMRVRWCVVRGVSDTVDEVLPMEAARWLTPAGETRIGRVLADLARKPWLLPRVVRVWWRCRRVLPRVGREVVRLARAELEGRGEPMGVPLLDRETEQTAVRDGETWSTPARPDGDAPDVLLFGGTFDPPHRGHFELAVRARELALGEDAWLVFVPAARNPHKTGGPIASDADRLDMLRAMCDGRERTAIWTEELDRAARTGEPSYWVNTLERTRQMLGDRRRIRFLIGADQAVAFDRWREPERILQLAMPLVLPRAPYTSADRLIEALHASGRPDAERWRAWFAPEATPLADCSSSRVRELIANGASDRELHGVVDGRVLEIIRERRLYGASTSGPGPLSRDHPRA